MKKEKLGLIIQARVGSTRLPNKINLPFDGDDTILDIVIKKILYLKESGVSIVLSTGSNKENEVLKDYAEKYNIDFFQGNEANVLDRFIKTSEAFNFSHIIRVCSDNPFLDVDFLNNLIQVYHSEKFDYYSYKDHENTPAIRTHLGLFVEIVSFNSLKLEEKNESSLDIIEHVTKYVYEHPQMFKINLESFPDFLKEKDFLRFTVDDINDFENLKNIYSYYKNSSLYETVNYIENNLEVKKIMKSNIQKYTK